VSKSWTAWTDDEIALLRGQWGRRSVAGISALLGRTGDSVRSKASRQRLGPGSRRPWTEADVATLRESYPTAMSSAEIGRRLGRTAEAVETAAYYREIRRPARPPRRKWPALAAGLAQLDREGLTNAEIAARFGCPRSMVTHYRRAAGLPPRRSGPRPGHGRRAGDIGERS
jgi:hypothetical protein